MAEPTIPALIDDLAARHGGRIAVSDGTRRLSFSELDALRREAGRGLMALGLEKGDRVALWADSSLEWIVAALALQSVGGVLVPLSTRLRGPEVAAILARARARLAICDPGFGSYRFPEALMAAGASFDQVVVLDGGEAQERTLGWPALLALAATVPPQAFEARARSVRGQDLSDILFTSGTTGTPKGVPMTHAQTLASCDANGLSIGLGPADVLGVTYPFAHNAGGRSGWLTAIRFGACAVAMAKLDAKSVLTMVRNEGVTVLPAVPTVHQDVLDLLEQDGGGLPRLRLTTTGATTIPTALIQRMREGYGRPVLSGYGLTEAAGAVTMCHADDSAETVATTVGRPIQGMEVAILGSDGAKLATGETGEIAVRGFTVLNGYYEDPAADAQAFTADGYLRTGDVGSLDDAGNLRVTDRLKDMYITGGFNCYPAEIEKALGAMPGVRAVAVIGVDDARLGQVGRAFVVPAAGATLTEAEVIAWSRTQIANYKAPREVRFLDALPLNATGKVAKELLRAQA